MPKQLPTVLQRIRLSIWYVTGKRGFGLIECCGVCGSTKIAERSTREHNYTYHSRFKCLSCGATANIKEKWRNKS